MCRTRWCSTRPEGAREPPFPCSVIALKQASILASRSVRGLSTREQETLSEIIHRGYLRAGLDSRADPRSDTLDPCSYGEASAPFPRFQGNFSSVFRAEYRKDC
eukprot:3539644-Rhodomonas_salina.1